MIPDFTALPAILWANGYRPVPIDYGCKFPYQKEWPIKAREDPPWLVRHGLAPYHGGIGLLGDGLRIVDADIDDPNRAAAFDDYMRQYPDVPLRYRAGSPRRVRLFRADGEPGKFYVLNQTTKERVEALGRGQQVHCYGVHPESGQPLQWLHGPHETARDELPLLTEEQVADILTFAATLIEADRNTLAAATKRVEDRPPRDGGEMHCDPVADAQWCLGDIRSALAAIPNYAADYDWWFALTCAVFNACGGNIDGYMIWLQWSGQCSAFDLFECNQVWRALQHSPTYYSAGTLAYYARLHKPDWDKPSYSGFTELRTFRTRSNSA